MNCGMRKVSCTSRGASAFFAGLAVVAYVLSGAAQGSARAHEANPVRQAAAQLRAFDTTVAYVTRFYPLWFTYYQSLVATHNRLVGPDRITPAYQIVVAINDDTLYASTFLDLAVEPVILTIPATKVTYSVLTLDPYGDIFASGIQPQTPGKYALTGPGFSGKLPVGITRIDIPLNHSSLIFRADKYASSGENLTAKAEVFRRSLTLQPLSDYRKGIPAEPTLILPVAAFAAPFKTIADRLIAKEPIKFLKMLKAAVAAPNTPALSLQDKALSDKFDALFADGDFRGSGMGFEFSVGTRSAHNLILRNYHSQKGPTHWVHFTNIGNWGRNALDRSSIAEFIQYGNGISTAAYYHAFHDKKGDALDGTHRRGYVLTIPKTKIPEAKRFWSITAYTPNSVELVRNDAHKYEIASYTPGLHYDGDGSLSIYMANERPAGTPAANWLPVPSGPFNVMLRVYGPEGSVAENTYVPPGIQPR